MPSPRGFFVTGTDTGVGKTQFTAALAAALAEAGHTVYPRKPAESGCLIEHQGETLFPQDGYVLQQASTTEEPLQQITPYRFTEPLSPERAAALARQPLTLEMLVDACLTPNDGVQLVEGAGGFYSPVAEGALNASLAVELQRPEILAAEQRLGAVNQVLLAHHAIRSHGLILALVVLNRYSAENDQEMGNLQAITQRLEIPVITLSEQTDTETPWKALVTELKGQLPRMILP